MKCLCFLFFLLVGCGGPFESSLFSGEPLGTGGAGGGSSSSLAAVGVGGSGGQGSQGGAAGAPLPAGWQAVVPAPGDACEAPSLLHAAPVAAACKPCGCGEVVAPPAPSCDGGGVMVNAWFQGGCPGGADTTLFLKPGACVAVPQGVAGLTSLPSSVVDASKLHCDPAGGDVAPAAPFAEDVFLCPGEGASAVCGLHVGEVECPAAFPFRRVLYSGAMDTRDCTKCSCGAAKASCSGAKVSAYGAKDCGGAGQPLGTCGAASSLKLVAEATLTGSCAASGGAPSGSVTPTGAKTLCCVVD